MKLPTHILVIRLSAMGDVAMTLPVLKALLRQNPSVEITVLSRAFLKPLFDDIPRLNFYAADVNGSHKGINGIYQLAQEVKGLGVNAIADLHAVLRSQILRKFLSLSRMKCAVIDKGRSEKKALVKSAGKEIQPLKTTHERYADVFRKLGYSLIIDPPERIKLALNKPIQQIVGENYLSWIGIAPFAQHQAKMYPEDLMLDLVKKLAANDKHKILLFGGGINEEDKLKTLENSIEGNVISVAGKLSFKEELVVISNLDLMVSMDSANGHLAATYGVPVLTIWGGTHPFAGFAPFLQDEKNQLIPDLSTYPQLPTSIYGNKIVKGYENVMRSINPNEINERITKILKT